MIARRLLPILLLATLVHARQTPLPDYTLTVTADRPDAIYHRNEKIAFTITALRKNQPVSGLTARWTLSKDGMNPQTGEADLRTGSTTITGSLDEPGFLQCRVDFKPPDAKLYTVRGAAAVDPLQIKPSLGVPDDFDAFWADQKKALAAIPLNVRLTPVKKTVAGVECFDLQADGLGGSLSAYLARPTGAKPASLPAIVLTHGYGVASSRLSVAAAWAKDGMLAIDFNAHGLPNDQPRAFYAQLAAGKLKNYHISGRDSRDTIFFRSLFLRLQRAIDVVTAQKEWDGKNLIANGRSQGGGQAIAAGGLDPRVTFIAAQIPALCDHTGIAAGRINGWPKLVVLDDSGKPDPASLQASRFFDAVNFAARSRAAAFFTVGFIDISCPPTGVYAAYNALPGPKAILNHVHTGHIATAAADAAVRDAILAHLKSRQ